MKPETPAPRPDGWGTWSVLSFAAVVLGVLSWGLFFASAWMGVKPAAWTLLLASNSVINPLGAVAGIAGMVKRQRFSLLWMLINLLIAAGTILLGGLASFLSGP